MIKRLRQNRSLRASKRQKFKGDNRETIYSGTDGQDKAVFQEFPKEQVDQVVNQIKQDFKAKRRKELILLISFFGLASILIIYAVLSSSDSSRKPEIQNITIENNSNPLIIWSGKKSEPIKFPNSNFLYVPIIDGLENELDLNGVYEISPSNLAIKYTSNILFFNKDSVEIGKLLPQNGSISMMFVGPGIQDFELNKIIYALAESDSNNDGIVDHFDRHFLYISDLDGKGLTKITERKINSIGWVEEGSIIQIRFNYAKNKNDSAFGLFNTRTQKFKLTNQPLE